MKILLTGATGYIGRRLLPVLLDLGHEVFCCVRNVDRINEDQRFQHSRVQLLEVDFLTQQDKQVFPKEIDVAYFLIHSMRSSDPDFDQLEEQAAKNFLHQIEKTNCKQIIYLGGITNALTLSKHLLSRKNVEDVLRSGNIPLTTLKAGIIVGSGSASFEIIRDLVEKLPLMITPKWLHTQSQPIAIRNVLECLVGVLFRKETLGESYDIAGPEVLTYQEMLYQFAKVRGLKRFIFTVPVMTPKLSSYWLYFVTSTSYSLAVHLVNSMKIELVSTDDRLQKLLNIKLLTFEEAVTNAFQKIEENNVLSSWIDSFSSSGVNPKVLDNLKVPDFGCYKDRRVKTIQNNPQNVLQRVWAIGGKTGWYYATWLWEVRGIIDKIFGGVGLRRGRTNDSVIYKGDALDFWRVLVADYSNQRLLLYAEMKLPGEAWLEFQIENQHGIPQLVQTATFRPKGILGRLYWIMVYPLHKFIFEGMLKKIVDGPAS